MKIRGLNMAPWLLNYCVEECTHKMVFLYRAWLPTLE